MATPLLYPTTTNAVQKTLDASLLTGVTASATLNNVTGIQNLKGLMVIDRVDGNNNLTPNKREYISFAGTSGSTVVTLTRGLAGSTDQDHAVGAIVEFVNDVVQQQAIIDGLLQVIDTDGNLDTSKVQVPLSKATATENAAGTDDAKYLTALSNVPAFNNSMARQAIINGNFDVWQRGTTSTNLVNDSFISDRWRNRIDADGGTLPTSIIYSRQILTSGDISGSFYHYRIAPNGAGTSLGVNSYQFIDQSVENGVRLLCGASKTVTLSFYARASVANKRIGLSLAQNYGTGGSPSTAEAIKGGTITLTSSWVKYTKTFTLNTLSGKTFGTNNDDMLNVRIWSMWGTTLGGSNIETSVTAETFGGSGTVDIAQVQLCAGDVALPFMPKSFEEELRACQRYCRKSYDYGVFAAASVDIGSIFHSYSDNNTSKYVITTVKFSSPMRTTPTLAIYDNAGNGGLVGGYKICTVAANATQTANVTPSGVDFIGDSGFRLYHNGTVAGVQFHYFAFAEL